ncbi:MAG: hypothetical protein R3B90_12895 [Planctomycetaceae bacterium]
MLDQFDKCAAAATIQQRWNRVPHAGIILGTGLGGLVEKIEVEASIEYGEIPHFLRSTATSHRGGLVCGMLEGLPVMAMEGRFHMYEGYPLDAITLPVRIFKQLGGGVADRLERLGRDEPVSISQGDLVVIDDHINLMGVIR